MKIANILGIFIALWMCDDITAICHFGECGLLQKLHDGVHGALHGAVATVIGGGHHHGSDYRQPNHGHHHSTHNHGHDHSTCNNLHDHEHHYNGHDHYHGSGHQNVIHNGNGYNSQRPQGQLMRVPDNADFLYGGVGNNGYQQHQGGYSGGQVYNRQNGGQNYGTDSYTNQHQQDQVRSVNGYRQNQVGYNGGQSFNRQHNGQEYGTDSYSNQYRHDPVRSGNNDSLQNCDSGNCGETNYNQNNHGYRNSGTDQRVALPNCGKAGGCFREVSLAEEETHRHTKNSIRREETGKISYTPY